jgi:hypothetical protein
MRARPELQLCSSSRSWMGLPFCSRTFPRIAGVASDRMRCSSFVGKSVHHQWFVGTASYSTQMHYAGREMVSPEPRNKHIVLTDPADQTPKVYARTPETDEGRLSALGHIVGQGLAPRRRLACRFQFHHLARACRDLILPFVGLESRDEVARLFCEDLRIRHGQARTCYSAQFRTIRAQPAPAASSPSDDRPGYMHPGCQCSSPGRRVLAPSIESVVRMRPAHHRSTIAAGCCRRRRSPRIVSHRRLESSSVSPRQETAVPAPIAHRLSRY